MFKISLIIISSLIILKFSGSSIINSQTVTVFLGNYEITTQQGFILLAAILFLLFLVLITYLLVGFTFLTKHKKVMTNNTKTSNALDHMVECMTLSNLGDYHGSQKALKQINKNLADHPIVNLLNIQSNNLASDNSLISSLICAAFSKSKSFAASFIVFFNSIIS